MMGKSCDKCKKCCTFGLLALGVLFLLQDLGTWAFWGISWYTALFLLVGVGGVATANCPDCKKARRR